MLRMGNVFGGNPPVYGNDLPSQGGITGNLPLPDSGMFGQRKNPYGGLFETQPIAAAPAMTGEDQYTLGGYTPEMEMQNRLEELLANIPQRNKPSLLRKIAASVIGAGAGPEAGIAFRDLPYTREMQDWRNIFEPTKEAANLERYRNQTERQYAADVLRDKAATRRIEETERHNREREEIAAYRARVYDFKSTHPNWKFESIPGGNVIAFNPQNPNERIDTKVPSGKLDEYDKINLNYDRREQLAEKQGEITSKHIGERGDIQLKIVHETGEEARETKKTPPGKAPEDIKDMSPEQARTQMRNNADKFKRQNPSLAKYINTDGTSVTITPPGRVIFGRPVGGPSQADYDRMVAAIEGTPEPAKAPETKVATTPSGQTAPIGTPQMQGPGVTSKSGEKKIGDIKTFPNGNKGKWDGKGWVLVK